MTKNLFCRRDVTESGNNSTQMNKRFQNVFEEIKLFKKENNSSLFKHCYE